MSDDRGSAGTDHGARQAPSRSECLANAARLLEQIRQDIADRQAPSATGG